MSERTGDGNHTPPVREPDGVEAPRRPDVLGRTIAITALVISALTFAFQFAAHESVSFVTTPPALITHDPADGEQPNAFVETGLTIFNRGNRLATLIVAQARLFPISREVAVKDPVAACENEPPQFMTMLLFGEKATNRSYVFSGTIEPGKALTTDLIFGVFHPNDKSRSKRAAGIVCLRLLVADSKGDIYTVHQPLLSLAVSFKGRSRELFENEETYPEEAKPRAIFDRRHLALPF
jgi:hypothetical protein